MYIAEVHISCFAGFIHQLCSLVRCMLSIWDSFTMSTDPAWNSVAYHVLSTCVCVRVPCSHVRVQVCPVVSGWPLLKRDILVMLLICRVNLTWPMTPLRRFARLSGFRLPSLPSKWTMLLGFCMPQLVLVYGVKLVLLDFSATMRMKT